MSQPRKKVLLAMSGGVDSSVAAALLLEAGYEVIGVFMCLGTAGDPDSDTSGCCSPQDAADARLVAQKLGIELYVLNLAGEFKPIIDYFMDEYARGRTPNPCIHCNTRIKFGRLVKHADSLGIPWVATGHYARLTQGSEGPAIFRKVTRAKDQSYVLFGIERASLGRLLFPLGEIENKSEVRDRARQLGLKVHDKPDSQEVCFVPDNDYVAYLRRRRPEIFKPGKILNSSGKILGTHEGSVQFTVGQRRGLGVAVGDRIFVTRIDPARAEVIVGPREDLLHTRLRATTANWHADVPTDFEATVQVRYHHLGTRARVHIVNATEFEVEFLEPVSAITPGQAAVCYDGDRLLGGGWIE